MRLPFLFFMLLPCVACEVAEVEPGNPGPAQTAALCQPARCEGSACDDFTPTAEIVSSHLPQGSAPTLVEPPPPLIARAVRLSDGAESLQPFIPANRTTADGRIALVGNSLAAMHLETLRSGAPVTQGRGLSGRILGDVRLPIGNVVPVALAGAKPLASFLCAPTPPRVCGDSDCYDIVLVQELKTKPLDQNGVVLTSIPLEVRVAQPKTAKAEIAEVRKADPSTWRQSKKLPFSLMAELLATGDGRVLVGRLLSYQPGGDGDEAGDPDGQPGADLSYRLSGGTTHRATFSLFYAHAAAPCDVEAWAERAGDVFTSLRPLPAAAFDERLVREDSARYGFAAAPLRDSNGDAYAETDVLQGSYPWIDREGTNLFFSTVNPGVDDRSATRLRFPMAREDGPLAYVGSSPRGFAVVGAWTQGKTIMLDGLLNNDDSGFRADDTHRLQLYRSGTEDLAVRVDGGGKDGTPAGIPNAHANNHHIESLENRHAMHLGSLPVTPRDVVWTVTRGLAMDEVAFDDYIDPYVVLLAEMNASWRVEKDGAVPGYNPRNGTLNDGFRGTASGFVHEPAKIRLQNAAASRIYPVIREGSVAGSARIEPVALGGVHGRGLWLEPGSRMRFALPAGLEAAVGDDAFLVGFFVDARDDLSGARELFRLAPAAGPAMIARLVDGAAIEIGGASVDVSCQVGSWARRWHHLGFLFEGTQVTVFLDGNPVATAAMAAPARLAEGELVVGGTADTAGVRGWYDEVRVVVDGAGQLTQAASVELLCNYARGTVLDVGAAAPRAWQTRADRAVLARTRAVVVGAYDDAPAHLVCGTDYSRDFALGRGILPVGTRSLREEILREGTAALVFDQPRPDSRTRSFCTTCHVTAARDPGRAFGLLLRALTPGQVNAALDPRTQPMQPASDGKGFAAATGFMPAGWITAPDGATFPSVDRRDPAPIPLLRWLLR